MNLIKAINFLINKKRLPTKSEVFSYLKIKRKKMPFPFYAQIEPTTRCNFNCLTCSRKTFKPTRLNRDLTLEEFKIILDKIPSLKFIKLQGMGEPLLNPFLEEILKYGEKKRISFSTVTNGSLLKWNKHLIKYFDFLTISFDSSYKEQFEELRKGANFDVIVNNIKEITDYKIKNNLKTKIELNVVVTHINYQQISEMVRLAKTFKVDSISFVEVVNWFTPLESNFQREQEFIKQSRLYSQKIKEMIEKERKKNSSIQINFSSSRKRKLICVWPFYMIYITVDGFITPCCIRVNPDVFNFGNIYTEDFNKIWNGEKYQKFRESILIMTPNPICDLCPD